MLSCSVFFLFSRVLLSFVPSCFHFFCSLLLLGKKNREKIVNIPSSAKKTWNQNKSWTFTICSRFFSHFFLQISHGKSIHDFLRRGCSRFVHVFFCRGGDVHDFLRRGCSRFVHDVFCRGGDVHDCWTREAQFFTGRPQWENKGENKGNLSRRSEQTKWKLKRKEEKKRIKHGQWEKHWTTKQTMTPPKRKSDKYR